MNDSGLDEPIKETFNSITHTLKEQLTNNTQSDNAGGPRAEIRHEIKVDEEEEEVGYYQPKRWWFTSTAFPLVAGTFGPLANLFSVCALVQTWRITIPEGETEAHGQRVKDPAWLLVVNSISLTLALSANLLLLFNFAHRVRYFIAQPLTIALWYIASILLIVPLGLTKDLVLQPRSTHAFSQSYYYALISAALYTIISSLLVFNLLGAYTFKAYPPSFNSLTIPQRTLMLQTMSYVFYLAFGAGIFSIIEGWDFVDGVYWADYTLLTIGLGTDFPLQTNTAKALLIPYAAGGITMLGLVIGSVRGLVLERGKTKVIRRTVQKKREKWMDKMDSPHGGWKKLEFEAMRRIESSAEKARKYSSLGVAFLAFLVIWLMGAVVFWFSEKKLQKWTYFQALYFTYTTLLTIGYGDYYPQSNSGKPFFVIWSLMAVPTVTVLISNMGDTVVGWLEGGTIWLSQRTILPERGQVSMMAPKKLRQVLSKKDKQRKIQGAHGEDSSTGKGLGGDVERLGGAVEKAEEGQGRGGGLAARIAKEISKVARDVGNKPPKKYEWEEWTRWLDILGQTEGGDGGQEAKAKKEDAEWTWLGDDGPLFSKATETEWILGKLCTRLEEVLEKELREVHHQGPN